MRGAAAPSKTIAMPCQNLQANFGTGERGNGTTGGDTTVRRRLIGPKRQYALAPTIHSRTFHFRKRKLALKESTLPVGWVSEITERTKLRLPRFGLTCRG
jgi:hypothetical protein